MEKKKGVPFQTRLIIFGAAMAFVALILIFGQSGNGGRNTGSRSGASKVITLGSVVHLSAESLANVVVAGTHGDVEELVRLGVAGDNIGIAKMVYDDRAFIVPRGTTARVIDSDVYYYRIRIIGGSHDTDDGWIPRDFAH